MQSVSILIADQLRQSLAFFTYQLRQSVSKFIEDQLWLSVIIHIYYRLAQAILLVSSPRISSGNLSEYLFKISSGIGYYTYRRFAQVICQHFTADQLKQSFSIFIADQFRQPVDRFAANWLTHSVTTVCLMQIISGILPLHFSQISSCNLLVSLLRISSGNLLVYFLWIRSGNLLAYLLQIS